MQPVRATQNLTSQTLAAVVLTLVTCWACAAEEPAAKHVVHWSYSGEGAPAKWGDLDPAYKPCKAGLEQTPIDIPAAKVPAGLFTTLTPTYAEAPLTILNNGHTVQVNYPAGSSMAAAGKKFDLVQFHFHAHSEHAVDGKTYPLEMHLVHKDATGNLGVLGIFIDKGAENAALKDVFDNLPPKEIAAKEIAGKKVDVQKALPAKLQGWTYSGSLTTPPCTEAVSWFVLADPIAASDAQIGAFTKLFPDNFRPLQPLGARTVSAGK